MPKTLTSPPKREFQSFHDFPIVNDLDNFEADIAIIGIPFGDPYSMGEASNDAFRLHGRCEHAMQGLGLLFEAVGAEIRIHENHRYCRLFNVCQGLGPFC